MSYVKRLMVTTRPGAINVLWHQESHDNGVSLFQSTRYDAKISGGSWKDLGKPLMSGFRNISGSSSVNLILIAKVLRKFKYVGSKSIGIIAVVLLSLIVTRDELRNLHPCFSVFRRLDKFAFQTTRATNTFKSSRIVKALGKTAE